MGRSLSPAFHTGWLPNVNLSASCSGMATVIPAARLNWKRDEGGLSLHPDRRAAPLLRVVPDADYPGIMWRIRFPDSSFSDMVNVTHAKDAAPHHALAMLNGTKGSRAEAPPVRQGDQAANWRNRISGPPCVSLPSSAAA